MGLALDLCHLKLRKVVKAILWVTVVTMLLVNAERLLTGYEEKVRCIYEATAIVVKDTMHEVITNATDSVKTMAHKLQDADFASSIKVPPFFLLLLLII